MTGTYAVRTTEAPSETPIDIDGLKTHLRIDHEDEDDYLATLIDAAVGLTQTEAGRLWVSQVVEVTCGGFPCPPCGSPLRDYAIALPVWPVQSVTSLAYFDADGVSQTLADRQVWLAHKPPLVSPAPGESWPATQVGRMPAVTLAVVGGYGAADAVPELAKQAIRLTCGYWYEHRGDGRDPSTWASTAVLAADLGLPLAAVRLLNLLRDREYH